MFNRGICVWGIHFVSQIWASILGPEIFLDPHISMYWKLWLESYRISNTSFFLGQGAPGRDKVWTTTSAIMELFVADTHFQTPPPWSFSWRINKTTCLTWQLFHTSTHIHTHTHTHTHTHSMVLSCQLITLLCLSFFISWRAKVGRRWEEKFLVHMQLSKI